jgi:hypothetical protein
MKVTLHTAAQNNGPFSCRPAMSHEIEVERVLTNDVVLPWERHYHGVQLWVIGNEFGAMGAVWAGNEQEAFDELCDQGLSGGLMVDDQEQDAEENELTHLGNKGELHDLTHAWCLPVEWDLTRDCKLLCQMAEARGANCDNLDKF